MWLVKLTGGGDLQWERSFRGTGTDAPFSLVETPADGYAAVGITSSSNGDVTGYHGGFYDQWVVRVDAAGELLWQKAMGGSADDRAAAIQRTEDGGYVIAGFSNSNDGDVTSAFPGYDLWLVKLAADDVSIPEHEPIWTLDVYPNPTAGDLAIAFTVPTYTMVRIEIRDVTGRLVALPLSGQRALGQYRLRYSTEDLPAGVYHILFLTNDRMVLRELVKS